MSFSIKKAIAVWQWFRFLLAQIPRGGQVLLLNLARQASGFGTSQDEVCELEPDMSLLDELPLGRLLGVSSGRH